MRLTRRDALLRTLALAGATGLRPAGAAAPAQTPRNPDINSILQGAVNAREVPGVVAMAATDRATIYQGAFGLRCLGAPAKMSTDTVFRIASMVKLLTSVAAMQLVESGKLSLDEPASQYRSRAWPIPVLTGFDAKGIPQLRPPLRPITLRNLLTHTSGFSYPLWDETAVRYYAAAAARPKACRAGRCSSIPYANGPMAAASTRSAGWWRSQAASRSTAISGLTSVDRSA